MEISGFTVPASGLTYFAEDLARPECVLAWPDGSVCVSDVRGMVSKISADGEIRKIVGEPGGKPNGFAAYPDGTLIVADIDSGIFYELDAAGRRRAVAGTPAEPLGACNFAHIDNAGRVWLSVSSRTLPVAQAIREDASDGSIYQLLDGEVIERAVGLRFANEVRVGNDGVHLYVAETLAGCVSRAEIAADGSLGPMHPYGPSPLFDGAYVDGLAFDVQGNLWLTELSRNAVMAIDADQNLHTICEDPEGRYLDKPTSVAFSGEDLKTVLVGSLKMKRLATFRSPIAGTPMSHWPAGNHRHSKSSEIQPI